MTTKLLCVIPSTIALWAFGLVVTAQPLPTLAPKVEDLPGFELVDPDTRMRASEQVEAIRQDDFLPLTPIPQGETNALHELDFGPAMTESSGSWLRRGLWYADTEAVIMTRTWDSNGATYAVEFDAVDTQAQLATTIQNIPAVVQIQSAAIGESSPGVEGMARFSLGRFLFRDQENRDHTVGMIVFGGGEFNEQLALQASRLDGTGFVRIDTDAFGNTFIRDEQGLHVPLGIDGSTPLQVDNIEGLSSFDRADSMEIDYSSRFHSWEMNYNVNQRMNKDRMELQPSGQWVRRAAPGLTWSYLAGFRYFDVEEQFNWTAQNIASLDNPNPPPGAPGFPPPIVGDGNADGAYLISASNNLFGVQLGLGMTYETDRWNVTVHSKHGFYTNDARVTENFIITDAPAGTDFDFVNDNHENALSFVSQGGITGRYHLRPNFSLRMGWEYLFVSGVALAPNYASFNPVVEQIGVTGDLFYQGVSIGTEYFW